jgi:ATP-binding cassette, subfamily B, bacterial
MSYNIHRSSFIIHHYLKVLLIYFNHTYKKNTLMARRRWEQDDDIPKPKLSRETLREGIKIFQFIKPYRWQFVGGLVVVFLSSLTFLILMRLPGEMIDIKLGKSKSGLSMAQIGVALVVMFVFQGVMSYLRVTLFAIVSEKGLADLRNAIYKKMMTLPISFFESTRVGELVSRVSADTEKLYNTFSVTLAEFIRQIILLITGVVFIFLTAPKLAMIMISTFPVVIIGAIFFGKYIRKLSKKRQDELAETNTILSETIQSINSVKAFTNELFEIRRYGRTNDSVVKTSMKYASRRALFATFIVSVLFGALFFIIYQGVEMIGNGLDVGQLLSFVIYTSVVGGAIAGLGTFYPELLGSLGATERVREILAYESEVNIDIANAIPSPENRLKGNIEFKDVKFNYPTRNDIQVLKGLNFSVKSGQKVALVGASGAGKSTIIQLMLKFHKATEGSVTIDGKNINDYNISEYRSNLAIVPQEVLLFGGTIRENILYGKPDATDAEILEASKLSNSWEFISQFPEGLETIVGERGIKLSGGQRQRIAIARAILRNPSILLLDEATSSLDAESEKVVQDALNILMEGRTSIIIAHRLATVREVDKICVIDGGRIVEEGTHEELSEMPKGIYAGLARLQFELV